MQRNINQKNHSHSSGKDSIKNCKFDKERADYEMNLGRDAYYEGMADWKEEC